MRAAARRRCTETPFASKRPVGVISTLDVAAVLAGVRPSHQDGAYHVAQLMTTNLRLLKKLGRA